MNLANRIVLVILAGIAGLSLANFGARAVEPAEMLEDPVLEQRARDLSQHLRCLVCQNQSIDDSNAELARDLRIIVRQRLVAGDSDSEVIQYLVDRYGDYVLLKPPVKGTTYALWYGPALILLVAVLALAVAVRRRRRVAGPPLSDSEQSRVEELLRAESGPANEKTGP